MQSSPPLERLSRLIATLESAREEINRSGPGINRLIFDALRLDSAYRVAKKFERIRSDVEEKDLNIKRYDIEDQVVIIEAFTLKFLGQSIPRINALKANKETDKINFPKMFKKNGTINLFFEEFKQIVDGLLLEIKNGKEDERLLLPAEKLIFDKLFDYAKAKYANYSETEEKSISSEKETGGPPTPSAKTWEVVARPEPKPRKTVVVKYMPVQKPNSETGQESNNKKTQD
jgi:hypothetical protein